MEAVTTRALTETGDSHLRKMMQEFEDDKKGGIDPEIYKLVWIEWGMEFCITV